MKIRKEHNIVQFPFRARQPSNIYTEMVNKNLCFVFTNARGNIRLHNCTLYTQIVYGCIRRRADILLDVCLVPVHIYPIYAFMQRFYAVKNRFDLKFTIRWYTVLTIESNSSP